MTSYDERARLGNMRIAFEKGEPEIAAVMAYMSIASSAERIATALEMQAAIQLHFVQENEGLDEDDLLGQYARAVEDTRPL